MTDKRPIVERLRAHGQPKVRIQNDHSFIKADCREAADLIVSLTLAFENILSWTDEDATQAAAREALNLIRNSGGDNDRP